MRRSLPWLFVLVLGGLLGPLSSAHAGPRAGGPMVGHVTSTTALIWMYAGARSKVLLRYRRVADPVESSRAVPFPPYTTGPGTCRVKLKGLDPNTKYTFVIIVNDRFKPEWRGYFKTAPVEGTPAKFRIAFTSCMDVDHERHGSFTVLYKQSPELLLLLGDNVYSDTTNRAQIWDAHLQMRRIGPFSGVIRRVPTVAIWDDHDFYNDNSDGTAPGKENSLIAFKELFPNPSFGLPGVPGVFFSMRWADVEFFMLDVRYHRSPNLAQDGPRKTMLGEGQHKWLVDGLRKSKARFKVLVSGSTLKETPEDSWQSFQHARARLYKAIREHRIEGVLLLSGDLHRTIIRVHPKASTGFYDLIEIVSSGIAVGGPENFATLDFDTTLADPTATVRVVERNGRVSKEQTIRLSALR